MSDDEYREAIEFLVGWLPLKRRPGRPMKWVSDAQRARAYRARKRDAKKVEKPAPSPD